MLAGPVARALGRHRQPRPRHLLPHAGRHPAVGRAGACSPRSSRSCRPGPRHLRRCSSGRGSDGVITWVVNIAVAFPGLLLALFFAVIFGVGCAGRGARHRLRRRARRSPGSPRRWSPVSPRATTSRPRGSPASAGSGCSSRHVLPNIGEPLIVNATIGAGGALLAFAGLSFLGLGVQPPAYDWGRLLGDGLRASTSTRSPPSLPASPWSSPGSRSTCSARRSRARARHRPPRTRSRRRLTTVAARRRRDPARRRAAAGDADAVLDVREPARQLPRAAGPVRPVRGISFTIAPRRGRRHRRRVRLGQVADRARDRPAGRAARARSNAEPARASSASRPARRATPRAHRRLLGTSLAMVFQDPMTSFNPTKRMGGQLAEVAASTRA